MELDLDTEMNLDDMDDDLLVIGDSQQYLFFILAGDIYAIDVNNISEMIEYQAITKVPLMLPYIKGVTNVRGKIITVLDLRERFGLGETKLNYKTSLVITNNIALIIDEVHEVTSVEESNLKESINFGVKIERRFVKNMASYNNTHIVILDCDEVLNIKEISQKRASK
ncbi:chemotaxis protein CheW [Sulfurimonas sp.]|uniref:chemotaxis protein CheW n=1 Tax=Sulfurimonas sp. TaxID=2022749 RepID=UPI0025D82084|nr:chemotaxis protein CheW [Sulfurimonas sp.]MBT5933739.1 purine-binding chemotaxis protein CheW [Sulfurimonas sp.]